MVKLKLINKEIVLEEAGVFRTRPIVLSFDFSWVHNPQDYMWYVIYNNRIRDQIVEGRVTMPDLYVNRSSVNLRVIGKHITEEKALSFGVDDFPMKHVIIFGKDIDELYPRKIEMLEQRIELLEQALAKKINEGELF
jgi:hypothetical protein